jgi:ankyrin repeat protein
LHYAAAAKAISTLRFLLSKGLYVDLADNTGSTALHTATLQQDFNTMRVLCEAGADINVKNESYMSPLDIAESFRDMKLVMALRHFEKKKNRF